MKSENKIIVIRASLIPSGTVPDEIQVVPFGKWNGYKQGGELVEFEVTRELASKAIDYHKKFNERFPQRDLPIDYEHQTLSGGEAPAAGWYKNLFLKNDGIYTKVKEWTKKAEQYLLNKEYRYQSPVLMFNDVDGESGETIPLWISSIALTNSPFLNGIQPVVAKNNSASTIIYLTDSNQSQPTQPTKGVTTMPTIEVVLQFLAKMLGLDPASTWEQIKTKLQSFMDTEGKEPGETVAAKYRNAMKALSLSETATLDDVKAFGLKHTSILQELGVQATTTIDEIKTVIAAKAKGTQQVDLKSYVLKSDLDAVRLQLKTQEAKQIIAKHVQRGAVEPNEIDDFNSDIQNGRIELKDLDARLMKRADYSRVPLLEIDAKNVKPNDGAPNVEQIKEYAAKNKIAFSEAAVILSKKK